MPVEMLHVVVIGTNSNFWKIDEEMLMDQVRKDGHSGLVVESHLCQRFNQLPVYLRDPKVDLVYFRAGDGRPFAKAENDIKAISRLLAVHVSDPWVILGRNVEEDHDLVVSFGPIFRSMRVVVAEGYLHSIVKSRLKERTVVWLPALSR